MRKTCLIIATTLVFASTGLAQNKGISFGGGGDLSFPMGEFGEYFKTGFGVYGKTMFGAGKAGQVSFTSAYSSFKFRGKIPGGSLSMNLIPLLVGYRHHFNGVFIEPQFGYTIIGVKAISEEEGTMTDSGGFVTWAAGAGYVFNKQVELSIRYQAGSKNGSSVNVFGLRLGYNFSLSGSKKN